LYLAVLPSFPTRRSSDLFNKDLLHLTYARLDWTPETKPWPMDELFPPVERRTREFIEHILSFGPDRIAPAGQARWRQLRNATRVKVPLQQSTSNVAESIVSAIEITESQPCDQT